MTGATLFSGIGAPECALPEIDWRWCAEIEPFPAAVHAHRFPGVRNLGDVTKVDWSQVEPVDLIVADSPCQAFSVAGLRKSLNDARGNLTLELVHAVNAIRPRFLLWENVPGVLSTADNAFGCFLAALVGSPEAIVLDGGWPRAGVVDGPQRRAAWRVLDAQYCGLAQRRERVFVVASPHTERHPAEILFEWASLRRDSPPSREAREDVAGSLGGGSGARGWCNDLDRSGAFIPERSMCLNAGGMNRIDAESETLIPQCIGVDEEQNAADELMGTLKSRMKGGGQVAVAFVQNQRDEVRQTDVVGALQAEPGMKQQMYIAAPAVAFCERGRERGRTLETQDDVADCLTNPGSGGRTHSRQIMTPDYAVRRLTPVECERLQGFPDGWTDITYRGKPAADGQRYKALGNSMAVPVIRWIGKRIMEATA